LRVSYQERERAHFFVRYFYDLIFWALVNILILNIVFGVILDSFASKFILTQP